MYNFPRLACPSYLHKSTPAALINHNCANIWRPFILEIVFSGRFIRIDLDLVFASYLDMSQCIFLEPPGVVTLMYQLFSLILQSFLITLIPCHADVFVSGLL